MAWLILFRIAWWTSAREELISWLSACAVLLCVVLFVFFSHFVSWAGCGIQWYGFLTIDFLSAVCPDS